MEKKYFGTDGVREIAGEKLTAELALKLGIKAAEFLIKKANLAGFQSKKFAVASDPRHSSDMLKASISSGLMSSGLDVLDFSILPTPALAYLVKKEGLLGGVMISASHNPPEYNGIKFFDFEGFKLSDSEELEVEKNLESKANYKTGFDIGTLERDFKSYFKYVDYLAEVFNIDLSLLKIVVDTAFGATSKTTPLLLQRLKANATFINDRFDSKNINVDCGSTNLEMVKRKVIEESADLGFAHDGDGDRVIFVDSEGNIVDGDILIYLIAKDLKDKGKLNKNTVVGTVMSNYGFELALKREGISLLRTKVGDRYILDVLLKEGLILGGEPSGHIINLLYNTTGDGLISALSLLSYILKENKPLKELASSFKLTPQVLENVRIKNKKVIENEAYLKIQKEFEDSLKTDGRILVRPSGTEALIRVMVEGSDENKIKNIAKILKEEIIRLDKGD